MRGRDRRMRGYFFAGLTYPTCRRAIGPVIGAAGPSVSALQHQGDRSGSARTSAGTGATLPKCASGEHGNGTATGAVRYVRQRPVGLPAQRCLNRLSATARPVAIWSRRNDQSVAVPRARRGNRPGTRRCPATHENHTGTAPIWINLDRSSTSPGSAVNGWPNATRCGYPNLAAYGR